MNYLDWFVDSEGDCSPRPTVREWELLRENYYLHQFLSDILEIIAKAPYELDEWDYLPQIRKKVRQLVINSYWLRTQYSAPVSSNGVHTTTLYDEIGYPLTILNVAAQVGVKTPIHNHGTWGVVFQIQGEERHTFWRRVNTVTEPLQIVPVGEHILKPGEMLSFHPTAIHQVETIGQEVAIAFQLYGDAQPKGRFRFEPDSQTAKPF
ncbi:MAG: cupin [Cyanobacteria bacterium P01_H01_bin.15]